MKEENRRIGNLGESIATKFLSEKGYEIIERNFSTRFGEIDIIAKKDGVLVFVEVKTKRNDDFGTPEDMVGKTKLGKVRRMATIYLDGANLECRIDMVAVVLSDNDKVTRISHHENLY